MQLGIRIVRRPEHRGGVRIPQLAEIAPRRIEIGDRDLGCGLN
jgi:hypothetical protein